MTPLEAVTVVVGYLVLAVAAFGIMCWFISAFFAGSKADE